jgi:hypothetical protein
LTELEFSEYEIPTIPFGNEKLVRENPKISGSNSILKSKDSTETWDSSEGGTTNTPKLPIPLSTESSRNSKTEDINLSPQMCV